VEPIQGEPEGGQARRHPFLYELLWSCLSNIVALFVATWILAGVDYGGEFWVLVLAGFVFGLVNAFVRPLILLLALPAIILTLGFALLLVNAFMLWLTDVIVGPFDVTGFWTTVGAAIIVSLVNWILAVLLRRDRRRRVQISVYRG
jgi:putative membrane protein